MPGGGESGSLDLEQHSPASLPLGTLLPTPQLLRPQSFRPPCAQVPQVILGQAEPRRQSRGRRAVLSSLLSSQQRREAQAPVQPVCRALRPHPPEWGELQAMPAPLPGLELGLGREESPPPGSLASEHQMPTLGWSPALAGCLQVAGAPGSGAILAPAPTPGHTHLLCLLGDPLGEPLAGEPLGDPFPWELLLSPLNMVLKAGVGLSWARPARVGRQRTAGSGCVSSLAAQLGSGEVGQPGTRRAVSGRVLPAGEAVRGPGLRACTPTPRTTLALLLHNQFGRKGNSPKGGAPALPESQRRFGLVTPNAQSQREPA